MADDQEHFEEYLNKLWFDRLNLPLQSAAHKAFGTKVEILSYEMDKLRSANVCCGAELDKQKKLAMSLGSQVAEAQKKLTLLLSEPWRAPLEFTVHHVANLLSILTQPFSNSFSDYFSRTASSVSPHRFQGGGINSYGDHNSDGDPRRTDTPE